MSVNEKAYDRKFYQSLTHTSFNDRLKDLQVHVDSFYSRYLKEKNQKTENDFKHMLASKLVEAVSKRKDVKKKLKILFFMTI